MRGSVRKAEGGEAELQGRRKSSTCKGQRVCVCAQRLCATGAQPRQGSCGPPHAPKVHRMHQKGTACTKSAPHAPKGHRMHQKGTACTKRAPHAPKGHRMHQKGTACTKRAPHAPKGHRMHQKWRRMHQVARLRPAVLCAPPHAAHTARNTRAVRGQA